MAITAKMKAEKCETPENVIQRKSTKSQPEDPLEIAPCHVIGNW